MLSFRACRPLTLALLFMVVWSRLWAGVPETVIHDGAVEPPGHEEVRDHLLSLSAVLDEHINDADDAEHQHHLHICGCGVALISALALGWPEPAVRMTPGHRAPAPVRRVETLLRPPIA